MRIVFGFRTTVTQRNALQTTLGDELVELALGWFRTLTQSEPVQAGALADGVFAWTGSVMLAEPAFGGDTVIAISVWFENGAASFDLQVASENAQSPFRTLEFRPAIIDSLAGVGTLAPSTASANGRPRLIQIDRARSFAEQLVFPQREIPIVVVTSNHAGKSAVRPTDLAIALANLAQVAHVQSTPVVEHLEKTLGSRLAVKEGDVRIYWPGLTSDSSEHVHRLFRPKPDDGGIEIGAVYGVIGRVLASQFRPDPRIEAFISAHPDTWPLNEEPEVAAEIDRDVDPAVPELAAPGQDPDLEREMARLQELISIRDSQIASLETALFEAKERIRQTTLSDRFSMDSVHQFALISDVLGVQTLADLVTLFESHVPDSAIVFLPEAHESARKSPFTGGLLGPAKLLEAVCSVATRYHFGNLHGGEDFKRAFEAAGETSFASDSSDSTLAKYRGKYARMYDDGSGSHSVLLRPHISFGSGRAHSSVKIYWYVDERNRRFVIGQIGEHLPIASRL